MTTVAAPETDALVGTVLADRYRLDEVLGQGGMGTVYRAEHVAMQKTVALKVLHPEAALIGGSEARFEREAIAAARIEHANVARALDFGRLPDGGCYFVIEYVEGESLAELVRRGPLEPALAVEIARQIASAIRAAHAAGIVHRDLKPANVMVGELGSESPKVKVLDFGVAKLLSHSGGGGAITRYGELVGTPEYMAPEQAGGGDVDHRVDLYALGVILYELLSGRPPFTGADYASIVAAHFTEAPAPLPDDVAPEITAIVCELLAKEPSARIQTAAELVERLDRVRPASAPKVVATPPPRRRWMLVAAAVVVASLSIGAVATRAPQLKKAELTRLGVDSTTAAVSLPPPEEDESAAAGGQAPAAEPFDSAEPQLAAKPTPQTKSVTRTTVTPLPNGKRRVIIRRRVIRRTATYSR